MTDNNNQQQQQQPQGSQPGLIGSHYQYAKGAAEATVGVITGSHAWKASGEQDKAAGLAALKKAGEMREQQDPNHQHGYGKAEEIAGKVTGCQGMEREGHASAHKRE
ncbi:hypothetical protein ACHAPT_004304 [Fusarium lateritium]